MTTPSGRWAFLAPNPYLSPYPNNVPTFPVQGEEGFVVYFGWRPPAPPGTVLVFLKPSGRSLAAVPYVASIAPFMFIPGLGLAYLTNEGDLDESGVYQVYAAQGSSRLSNNAPLPVLSYPSTVH